jgi:membrane fusion protein, multidrug efflux system
MRHRAALILGATGFLAAATVVAWGAMAAPAAPSPPPDPVAVPVTVAPARRQDVPIFADGLGTVQAYAAVTVRSRVDGALVKFPVAEGQEVRQGDVIAEIDPRPYQAALDAAQAKKTQDTAMLANAKLDLARYQPLARQDFVSRQQLDAQQALVNEDTAALAADDAAIQSARLNLSFCSITSPVNGRVGLRLVDPGNLVHATDATGIVTITQVHPIAVTFTLPQRILPRVQAAMASGPAPVLAFSEDDSTQLDKGTLLTPDNTVDVATGTIRLKATFANAQNQLWPGAFVNAHLQIDTARNAVTVPPTAIQRGPDGLYVFVVKPDSTVAQQPVTAGYQTDSLVVVTKGLTGGESVVASGQSRLSPGVRVATTPAPATDA